MAEVKTPIYFDYQSTTPVDERVLEAMLPYLRGKFGNPHSITHRFGWEAEAGVSVARERIAKVIGAAQNDIVFTSGATESNNLAVKGIMSAHGEKRPHMVTVVTEHKCLLESARAVERWGLEVTRIGVRRDGLIDLDELRDAVTDKTALVSVMAVNNEIGVIQPLREAARIAHEKGAFFHTDAAQAFGKIPLDVEAMEIDLMSLSGHKIYGPKGVGALYLRSNPYIAIVPQMSGGGQERGLRSGTVAPAQCVGFGEAGRLALEDQGEDERRIEKLSKRLSGRILGECPGAFLNGSTERRYWGNLNLSFPGLDGDLMISKLRELAVSSGAACASATAGPSYVLQEIGLPEEIAKSSLRIGLGRFTTEDEVEFAADRMAAVVEEMGGIPEYMRQQAG